MQKKLLVTVSDDVSCLHGVRFVGSFFSDKSAVAVTLFYVAPHAAVAGRGLAHLEVDSAAAEACRKRAQTALDAARRMLCDRGFPADNVTSKFIFREFGTVKDIVREARLGAYDAVVLGRRGYMLFESTFSISITKEILDQDIDFPVWICRHPDENRRNVLLCIDGSLASLRMVDHVGFMLKGESEHSITLCHVDTGEVEDREAILQEARGRLIGNWMSDGRVETIVVPAPITGVAKVILDRVESQAYAAIGVGRVGIHKGRLKEWLVGSRTMKLVELIEKAALWVGN